MLGWLVCASAVLLLPGFLQAAVPQTITFGPLTDRGNTEAPFALAATASSGLPVSFSIVSIGNVATLTGGSTVALTGTAGAVTVCATQAGDATHAAATPVYRTFRVTGDEGAYLQVSSGRGSLMMGSRRDGKVFQWAGNLDMPREMLVFSGMATRAMSVGWTHYGVVRDDGVLVLWGAGHYGELGTGSSNTLDDPGALHQGPWATVACGTQFTLAVRTDGTLWACGRNGSGRLGDGTLTDRMAMVQVGTSNLWAQVAAGENHSAGIRTDGTRWTWGANLTNQLGDGTTSTRTAPVRVGTASNWSQVCCGNGYTLALRTDGSLWAWGLNADGQLGDGTTTQRPTPVRIGGSSTYISVSASAAHTGAVRADGTLWAWGSNASSQLGDGTTTSSSSPVQVGPAGSRWTQVMCSLETTAALQADGSLWSWGGSNGSQLGRYSLICRKPEPVSPAWDFVQRTSGGYSAGYSHGLGVRADGTLWAWGSNFYGQLGDGTTTNRETPVQIGTATNWARVAASNVSTMAIRKDGTLWSWGDNTNGQLGNASYTSRAVPGQVGTASNWKDVVCGNYHVLALRTDGTLWAWGNDYDGQLGVDSSSNWVPNQVGTATNWTQMAAGANYSFAINASGELWAFGSNQNGELGRGTNGGGSSLPSKVFSDTPWVKVQCIAQGAVAIKADGTLWAWGGENSFGQHGTGDQNVHYGPTVVGNFADWVDLAASDYSCVALRSDGTRWGWGYDLGQLGGGTLEARALSPRQLDQATNWSSLVSRQVGKRGDGTLWTWGGRAAADTRAAMRTPGPLAAPTPQAVSFTVGALFENTPHTLAATATSGLPATYTVAGPATIQGNVLTPTGTGMLFVTAYQQGDANWDSADSVTLMVEARGPGPELELFGRGQRIPTDDTTPTLGDGTDFGRGVVNTNTVQREFVLQNEGVLDLVVSGITLAGAQAGDFSVSGVPAAPIPPGGMATFTVSFVAGSTGARQATVRVASNDEDEGLCTFAVRGAGTAVPEIDFPLVNDLATTQASYDLGATASSGLPVSYTVVSSPPGVASVSAGGVLTLSGTPGAVTVRASQPGNGGSLGPAADVHRTFMVVEASQAFKRLATGMNSTHSAAIRADDTLWLWGSNSHGQLGNGTQTSNTTPTQLGTSKWRHISCGRNFTCGLTSNGDLWVWGNDEEGQVSFSQQSPGAVRLAPEQRGPAWRAMEVNCGRSHTLIRMDTNYVMAVGANEWGQLGINSFASPNSSDIGELWARAAGGNIHSVGVRLDGSLWTWGDNTQGQLGVGSSYTTTQRKPLRVGTANDWKDAAAGLNHTAAIKTDGTLWAWGKNDTNQVTSGTTALHYLPVQVGASMTWAAVAAGAGHTVGLRQDGSLWAWGANANGQLGDGTTTARSAPVPVAVDGPWTAVSCGESATFALRQGGTLWAWGQNGGHRGLGTISRPTRILPAAVAQAVTFNPPASVPMGRVLTLQASATSGLPAMTYSVSGPATLAGNVLTTTGTGTVSITATQPGDATWLPAATVRSISVGPAVPETDVFGNGVLINSGSTTPGAADHTDFGEVAMPAGTQARTFTITNTGTAMLQVASASLSGPHAADFTVTQQPIIYVDAGVSTALQITFNPKGRGLRQATVTFASTDADENYYTFAIQGTGLGAQEAWRRTHFGTTANTGSAADTADMDGDGLPNLLEYACALSPVAGGGLPAQISRQGASLHYNYPRSVEALNSGVTYVVEWTDTLGAAAVWSSVGVTQSILSTSGGTQEVQATLPAGANGRRFVHLRVTGAP